MTKTSFKRLITGLIALVFISSTPAAAQICGLQTVSGGSVAAVYDPFSPSGTTIANTTIILQRLNLDGSPRTNTINFYFDSNSTALNGMQVLGVSIAPNGGTGSGSLGGGTGQNLYFQPGEAAPILSPTGSPSIPNRTAFYNFNGNAPSNDSFQLTATVILPPNLNTAAGATIPLNLRYSCIHGQGGNATVETGSRSNALIIDVTVLSALQASYVGPILDFGEVGDKTTTQVQAAPGTYTRAGDIRVASSGAYEISMTSTNNYRLTFPGGNPSTPGQSLAYNATLAGVTRSGVSGGPVAGQTPITKTCVAAGVGGILRPVSVTLTEGGSAKTPAPAYTDTLNVTVTPKVVGTVGSPCP
jgi:hypothetical protein